MSINFADTPQILHADWGQVIEHQKKRDFDIGAIDEKRDPDYAPDLESVIGLGRPKSSKKLSCPPACSSNWLPISISTLLPPLSPSFAAAAMSLSSSSSSDRSIDESSSLPMPSVNAGRAGPHDLRHRSLSRWSHATTGRAILTNTLAANNNSNDNNNNHYIAFDEIMSVADWSWEFSEIFDNGQKSGKIVDEDS